MDLVSGITAFNQATLMSKVQMKVARKVLDQQEMQGQAAIQLIEAAGKTMEKGNNALGGTLDVMG